MLVQKWKIELLGGVSARQGSLVVDRFATRHSALMLAYLAHFAGREITRDVLVEMLWPDVDLETGRGRFRVALASLRRQLEPPGTRYGSVLIADRQHVTVNPEACSVDSTEFRALVELGLAEPSPQRASQFFTQADSLYGGPFCGDLEADWIIDQRLALTELQVTAQIRLSHILFRRGDIHGSVRQARRAAHADPLSEPARRVLIRHLLAGGQVDAARLELEEFRRLLKREAGLDPSMETLRLFQNTASDPVSPQAEPVHSEPDAGPKREYPGSDHLPRFTDRYIERFEEFAYLEGLLGVSRLITMTGPGGIGKTRLAAELLPTLAPSFRGGIWFVPVLPGAPARVLDLILETLDPTAPAGSDSLPTIARILNDPSRPTAREASLIVLDGAEVLSHTAPVEILALLRAVPGLTLLVTSRRRLGIVGEQEYQVKPLELPEISGLTDLEELAGNPSIRLFIDRARSVRPDFQLNGSNADSLTRVCASLDGIPLAIELAAARTRRTPVKQLLEELSKSPGLEDPRTWRPERHRSVHAALASTVRSLEDIDKRALAQLTVFRSSWDVEAAEGVLQAPNASGILERLVENSLLVKEQSNFQIRYRMLSSIRSFAAGQIEAAEAQESARLHANHFLQRALRLGASILQVGVFMHTLPVVDRENFRASLAFYARHSETTQEFCSFVVSLTWYWIFGGSLSDAAYWIPEARDRIGSMENAVTARVRLSEGILACYQDDAEASVRLLGAAIQLIERFGNQAALVQARWAMGFAKYLIGDFAEARTYLETTLEQLDQIGAVWWIAATHNLLGFVSCAEHKIDEAERHFIASREEWESVGDRPILDHMRLGLARVYWLRGEWRRAETTYREGLQGFLGRGDDRGVAYCLEGMARVSASLDRYVMAARLLGSAQRVRDDHGLHMDAADSALHAATTALLQEHLGGRYGSEWKSGHEFSPELVLRYVSGAD